MTALARPSLLRLIGAVLYDWFILLGLLILAGFIPVTLSHFLAGRDAIEGGVSAVLFWLWNLIIIQLYFVGFWHTKRQTVGMRVWRIHIDAEPGQPPSWRQGLIRFWTALPAWGLALVGILWRYGNAERRSWPDLASQTELVYTPKVKKKS
ncbi:RDD family protein [Saccharospirillum mangrovi]|uniref:RDD family protein n=1 Tax=Saccharospirillum mangrovi TaxID=2161747 RepID=UPI000D39A0F9|nr:RDD family protein [Saccharospirillum mangrovi]